jgi:hypothetical protein
MVGLHQTDRIENAFQVDRDLPAFELQLAKRVSSFSTHSSHRNGAGWNLMREIAISFPYFVRVKASPTSTINLRNLQNAK